MRKAQKEQAKGFVKLLEEAHNEIINLILKQDYETALDILEQCQQGAIQIGTLTETTEGEGFVTVKILEEYCELVYNIHCQIVAGESINVSGIQKVLKKNWLRISNSVQNDIKVKKEVLFLPYKVAMWDSLESVWMAAKEDPECDTYVVPIPYYMKNADETLGEMRYEGNEYPDYVHVTDYRKYDIEKRRPDVIYIHNPYDQLNAVTSVHPDYYACRLCELTEMLVYIPYFVSERHVQRELRVVPGTIYAHRVIVASEKEKADYIEGFERWLRHKQNSGDYELYQPYWREKFLVLGSPKYDKVMAAKRDRDRLPKEWADMIYKDDGSRRKVLFYNTSINAMLGFGDMMAKIRRTIEMVAADDNVVLWWRPHPLYEATISTSRPHMLEEYRHIVAEYKEKKLGIFDDTPDLDRAIVESDAYYGDGSSVTHLFAKLNKPVMIQNVDI